MSPGGQLGCLPGFLYASRAGTDCYTWLPRLHRPFCAAGWRSRIERGALPVASDTGPPADGRFWPLIALLDKSYAGGLAITWFYSACYTRLFTGSYRPACSFSYCWSNCQAVWCESSSLRVLGRPFPYYRVPFSLDLLPFALMCIHGCRFSVANRVKIPGRAVILFCISCL